jgi:hypothetical protein
MKLTREDLVMMLDAMNNYGVDYISIDARVCDEESDYIDFDIDNGAEFIKTVLTLKS